MANKVIQNVRLIQKCFIVNSDNKVLALKRPLDDKSRGGCWDTPGGGYEEGENVVEAIVREIKEESDLTANNLTPIFIANNIGIKEGFFAGQNVFGICYSCRDWEGEVKLSEEHTEYKWVTPQEFLYLDFGSADGFFVESMNSYLRQFDSLPAGRQV